MEKRSISRGDNEIESGGMDLFRGRERPNVLLLDNHLLI